MFNEFKYTMMKRLGFILLLICIGLSTSAQVLSKEDITITDNSFSYVYQTHVPLTKLFGKVNQWVARSFKDYKSVIQYEDKENYRLIMKGILLLDGAWVNDLSLILTFDCKEGKYRVMSDGLIIRVNDKELSYEQYINASVEDIFGAMPYSASTIQNMESQRDIAKQKFEKAQKKWKPGQFHYEGPKKEFESLDEKCKEYNLANELYAEKAALFLQTRDVDIKVKLATLYNNISSFIAADDDF